MNQTFKDIIRLSKERIDTKNKLKCIEQDLIDNLQNLPNDVLLAIAHDIVKPTFPVPHHILCDLKSNILNNL